jgi:uncharacterized protein (DUF2384 family)
MFTHTTFMLNQHIRALEVKMDDLYAGDKTNARIFLNAPNRSLENRAPIEFIQDGDLTPLELFVDAMSARQPVLMSSDE